jgi:hypothetical protein
MLLVKEPPLYVMERLILVESPPYVLMEYSEYDEETSLSCISVHFTSVIHLMFATSESLV